MNIFRYVSLFFLFVCLSMQAYSRNACMILSPPIGVPCNKTINEASSQLIFTCPGLSVVELQEYCVQHAASKEGALNYMVQPTIDGAALQINLSDWQAPVVTIASGSGLHQVIIAVRDASRNRLHEEHIMMRDVVLKKA